MPIGRYESDNLQNAYWEGFTQPHEITNIFVFSFFGTVIHAAVNYPGSWHDSKVSLASGLYYPRLSDSVTPPGLAILADSAFPRNADGLEGKIVRARKANEMGDCAINVSNTYLSAVELLLDRAAPSERQTAEWGIGASKQPFGRLRVTLPGNSKKRLRLLTIAVHLFNFRSRTVGSNEIKTVYADTNTVVQLWVRELLTE